MSDGLLDEILFASAQGGRKPHEPLLLEVERPLEEGDLETLMGLAPPAVPAQPTTSIVKIRYAHHQIARLLALGTAQQEISLLTGYSPAYISTIKNDPTFRELLDYYGEQKQLVFVDVLERMKTLGISALEELQKRVDEEPENWTKRELMELAEMNLIKPLAAAGRGLGASGSSAVTVAISFVQPEAAAPQAGPILDLEKNS